MPPAAPPGNHPIAPRAPAGVYVYYRLAADTAAARDAVTKLFAAVAAATGVAGRLLARCDDAATWMEVYEPIADTRAFVPRLAALAQSHRVAALAVDGKRHTECFAPLPAVAPGSNGHGRAPRAAS
jgi:hypothetical protein